MTKEFYQNIKPSDLTNIYNSFSAKKLFVVTAKSSFAASGAKDFLENSIEELECIYFNDFTANPKIEDAVKGAQIFKENNCDLILAIGGGSVMDMAKLINAFQANDHLESTALVLNNEITNKGVPLVVIPTTSGSGSESTHFAVVYVSKKKYSLAHAFLKPDIVGLNAQLTDSQSSSVTVTSGLDALSQAIESYWSVNSMDESKAYSRKAIRLVLDNLETCAHRPNLQARESMSLAAYYAGCAINITKTTAPHALSYVFTSYFDTPHGVAVFLTLPRLFLFNYGLDDNTCNDKRGVDYVKASILELTEMFDKKTPMEASKFLYDFSRKIVEDYTVEEEIRDVNRETILSNVNVQRLSNNPRKMNEDELWEVLTSIKL